MKVAVWGAGGHGHDIAATLDDFAGFVDDDPERGELPPCGDYELILGMNDPHARYDRWRRTLNFRWHNDGVWVHPAANVGPSVKLGQHTHVNAGAFLTRCTVGEFCSIAPNATVLGDVTLGDRVMVGANATIRNLGGWVTFTGRLTDAESEKWLRQEFIKAYHVYAKSGVPHESSLPLPGLNEVAVKEGRLIAPEAVRIACDSKLALGVKKPISARLGAS